MVQIPSSCGWLEDAAWGVAVVLAALLILSLVPIAVTASAASEVAHLVSRW